jgi:hypothetical protein
MAAKDTKLTVMVTEDDMAKLKRLAEVDDVSASQVVRLMIRRTHAERFEKTKKGGRS